MLSVKCIINSKACEIATLTYVNIIVVKCCIISSEAQVGSSKTFVLLNQSIRLSVVGS